MQFVYPSFLFALAAIAIPIIIHLFHFRRYKKIMFSDLRFLKQIQEQNKSKQKLKDLLVLLSRILAILFLVLAFAQPFIPAQNALQLKGQKAISVFVDNSFSMNNEGPEGNLLETAKTKARAIVNAYGADDEFQILSHDFDGRHQRLVNKTEALTFIDELKITPASVTLSAIIQRQKQALEKAGNNAKLQYVISDFQAQMCNTAQLEIDSNLHLNFIPIKANQQQNIDVDSIWFASPVIQLNQPITIKARIKNYGETAAENIAITLTVNNLQKGLQNISCPAEESIDIEFAFTPTTAQLYAANIAILDHPITFDDKLYFSFKPVAQYNVLAINGNQPNLFISKIFESDATYNLTQSSQSQLNYSSFTNQQLIILKEPTAISSGLLQELKKYIEQGGQLLISPSTDKNNIPTLNTFLTELQLPTIGNALKQSVKVSTLNVQDVLFKNVFQRLPKNMDLPSVTQFYELQTSNTSKGKALMELASGQPFAWQAAYKKGNIVLLSSPLQMAWSNFVQHAIYVPFMLKLGTGKPQPEKLYYTIGLPQTILLQEQTQPEKLIRFWGNETELALQTTHQQGKPSIYLEYALSKAGIYNIAPQGEKEPKQLAAMNFDRKESTTKVWNKDEMEAFVTKWPSAAISNDDTAVLQHSISNQLNGTPFWRYCVWLTLVFVLIEILLLRLLKG